MLDGAAIDRLLDEARRTIGRRVSAAELDALLADGRMLVVDMRPVEQRSRDGELPGAVAIDRNVLEWRLDATSAHRIPAADDPTRPVVLVCNEGYASSLAAATLRSLGRTDVTDVDGGYQAWIEFRTTRTSG